MAEIQPAKDQCVSDSEAQSSIWMILCEFITILALSPSYSHNIPLKSAKSLKKTPAAAKAPSVFEAAAPATVHVLVEQLPVDSLIWKNPEEIPLNIKI